MASITLKNVTVHFDRVVGQISGYRDDDVPDQFYFYLRITNNRATPVTIYDLHSGGVFYEKGNTRYSSEVFTIPAGALEQEVEIYYSGLAEHYLLNNNLQAWLRFEELLLDDYTAVFDRYEPPGWVPPNTGYKAWAELEEYYTDTGETTGITKVNDSNDLDYVAPVYDTTSCPL